MKLEPEAKLPALWERGRIAEIFRDIAQQVNRLTEGRIKSVHNAMTAAPTTGTYLQGDFIRNSAPAEAGTAGNKYLISGWMCTTTGTPGTFKECRFLTGN